MEVHKDRSMGNGAWTGQPTDIGAHREASNRKKYPKDYDADHEYNEWTTGTKE